MREISTAAAPYGLIKEAGALIREVEAVNDALLRESRDQFEKKVNVLSLELEKDV